MTRLLPITLLLVTAGWLGFSAHTAIATEVTTRKGEEIPAPPPPPGTPGNDVLVLGSIQLPAEVVRKLDADQLQDILKRQVAVPKTTVEHIFNEEILVPAIVFMSLTVVSFMLIYFSFRKRREMLDTVRIAIQSGQTLPASFLEALESKRKPSPDGDLRKSVLLIALGLSGTIVLAAMGDKEMGRAWAIGLVPTLLGVGYLFLWRQSQKRGKTGINQE